MNLNIHFCGNPDFRESEHVDIVVQTGSIDQKGVIPGKNVRYLHLLPHEALTKCSIFAGMNLIIHFCGNPDFRES